MILDAVIPLHASYWDRIDHPLLEGVTKVDDPPQIAGIAGGCAVGWDPCVSMFPEAMPDDIRAVKENFLAAVPELHHMVGGLVQTVIHGDLRLDNMMFGDTPDVRPVVLLDWTSTRNSLNSIAGCVEEVHTGSASGKRSRKWTRLPTRRWGNRVLRITDEVR